MKLIVALIGSEQISKASLKKHPEAELGDSHLRYSTNSK
jgi:hypothetical protein